MLRAPNDVRINGAERRQVLESLREDATNSLRLRTYLKTKQTLLLTSVIFFGYLWYINLAIGARETTYRAKQQAL